MASPQTGDGFVRVANELYEAILRAPFSKRQIKVMMALIRESYGRNSKNGRFSPAIAAAWTSMDERNARTALRELMDINAITVIREARGSQPGIYQLQKDYEAWNFSGLSDRNDSPSPVKTTGVKYAPEGGRGVKTTPLTPVKTTGVTPVKTTPHERQKTERHDLNPVADHVNPAPPISSTLIGRLEKLQNLQMPREALLAMAAWFKQPFQRPLLEIWLEAGLERIEQAFRQGRKFGKTAWKFVFEEAENAKEADRHERYGYPREVYKGRKVFFKPDGEPCDCNGIPMNYHPAHPDYAEFYGPGPPVFEQPF